MTNIAKPTKWKVRNLNHQYGTEFKFDDYLDRQIKFLAEKVNRGEVLLGKEEK